MTENTDGRCSGPGQPPEYHQAVYTPSGNPAEAGNPFLEALPPVWEEEELGRSLVRCDPFDPSLRTRRREVRLAALDQIKFYYQPLPRDMTLAFDILSVIRAGYLDRNPVGKSYRARLKRGYAAKFAPLIDKLPAPLPSGRCLIGMSGLGKSTSLRVILDCVPQVIRHDKYQGTLYYTHQLVWLAVNCPARGSPKSVCIRIIRAVDALLGENYSEKYGIYNRVSLDVLQGAVEKIARDHGIGLIVIDEIQNLRIGTKNQRKEALTFLTGLMNDLKVPVVFVGTEDALPIITKTFAVARRTGLILHRFERLDSEAFSYFLQDLWDYQLLDEVVPYDDDWASILYHYTQGIPDIAVKLFIAAQQAALTGAFEGAPKLSVSLFREVWNEKFQLIHHHMAILRDGGTLKESDYHVALLELGKQLDKPLTRAGGKPAQNGSPGSATWVPIPDHSTSEHAAASQADKPRRAKARRGRKEQAGSEVAVAPQYVPSGPTLSEIAASGAKNGEDAQTAIRGQSKRKPLTSGTRLAEAA